MFERFTDKARRLVVLTQEVSRELGHTSIRTDHLLVAVLRLGQGHAPEVLAEAGIDADALLARLPPGDLGPEDADALATLGISLEEVERRVDETFGPGALRAGPTPRHIPFESEAKKALEQALREALKLGSRVITADHVVLGALHEKSRAATLLTGLGADPEQIRAILRAELGRAA